MTPEERKREKHLLKCYGITNAEYEVRLAQQGGGCAVCGRPAGTRRLSVDHSHRFEIGRASCRERV